MVSLRNKRFVENLKVVIYCLARTLRLLSLSKCNYINRINVTPNLYLSTCQLSMGF